MYIVINIETKIVDLVSNMQVVALFTKIPINKITRTFSQLKLDYLEYLQYQVYKRSPITKHILNKNS